MVCLKIFEFESLFLNLKKKKKMYKRQSKRAHVWGNWEGESNLSWFGTEFEVHRVAHNLSWN